MNYSTTDQFPSELVDGGYVKWQKIRPNSDGTVGPIPYQNVRWEFNQKPFGWSSIQHVVYFRGNISIQESGFYSIQFQNVHSFKINQDAYLGNIYNDLNYQAPSVIFLNAGLHSLYICTILDIRIVGGSLPPKPSFSGSITALDTIATPERIIHLSNDDIMPESMNDNFITPFASVTIQNARLDKSFSSERKKLHGLHNYYSLGWIQLEDVIATDEKGQKLNTVNPNTMYSKDFLS